ncbi:CoA pyrophosphatase [Colwellia sp. D2M02]|uniref:CoA pyrophosphatase n=1 Tax=Colwellia asteriadis TaxID=517723 RepID=A0ABN1LAI8_9GAMM|nr:CoA pyrophosphatase [Colwellia sp. D2M02]MBU2894514.1 CoA pyrophosphatase [Colwellia sp. D2M02]
MTKDDFLLRFNLLQLGQSSHNYIHPRPLKSAAVLITLIEGEHTHDGLQVLLTKRASHLKHHPSQVSFPGGKVEPSDANPTATALREAQEEIGLLASAVNILGTLPPCQTISGFHVIPIVAMIDNKQQFLLDKNEVAEIFQVPLQHFFSSSKQYTISTHYNGNPHNVHFMPYKHYNIWGATASMLKDLIQQLN